jgi:hypothetical protein
LVNLMKLKKERILVRMDTQTSPQTFLIL